LERVGSVVVPILREQDPTLLLTAIPQEPIIQIARELKVAKRHETKVELDQDGPEAKGLEEVLKVR
jgi:hypothetical protein